MGDFDDVALADVEVELHRCYVHDRSAAAALEDFALIDGVGLEDVAEERDDPVENGGIDIISYVGLGLEPFDVVLEVFVEEDRHRLVAMAEYVFIRNRAVVGHILAAEGHALLDQNVKETFPIVADIDHGPFEEFQTKLVGILLPQRLVLVVPHIEGDDVRQGVRHHRKKRVEAVVEVAV